jgi:hypothetical protein
MLKLPMTARGSDMSPTVTFQTLDDLTNFHLATRLVADGLSRGVCEISVDCRQ